MSCSNDVRVAGTDSVGEDFNCKVSGEIDAETNVIRRKRRKMEIDRRNADENHQETGI
jgi:hypothetical protein